MTGVATFGYVVATFAFFVLSAILAIAWRGRQEGAVLLLASVFSTIWAGVAAYQVSSGYFTSVYMMAAEVLRDVGWLGFLLLIMLKSRQKTMVRSLLWVVGILALIIILMLGYVIAGGQVIPAGVGFNVQIFVFLALTVVGLVLVEQIFRNASQDARWFVKYLCLGLGSLFAYDFYLYSDALLLKNINENILGARGYINAIVMPLIAVSAARNPQWSLDVFVSRSFVFRSSALMVSGLYLLAMASGGYYIKHVGGDWGALGQFVFFFGAVLVLLVVLFSGQVRARLRVFLNKHFFNYRYDYREEWLRVIQSLSEAQLDSSLKTTVVSVMAKIVESPGGMLWVQQDGGNYQVEAGWNMPDEVPFRKNDNAALLAFLSERKWVIDLDELSEKPESYKGLGLPSWLSQLHEAWLIVPLFMGSEVALSASGGGTPSSVIMGFLVLRRPRAKIKINWEVRDLLLTTGRQCAGYLALLKANEDLVDARQFEAFNRLSAYVVHDLKNLVAQLSLIVTNAERHKGNPDFINDAFTTVENTVSKMNYMLAQLRKGRVQSDDNNKIELNSVLAKVVRHHSKELPVPEFISTEKHMEIIANENRFSAVIGHLIQNAQEATHTDGFVQLRICREGAHALLLIKDNGCGMDKTFLRERLFKPFDTTKGNAGMGIGVYESRDFIGGLDGQLDVHSEKGKGTTFFIRLKLANNTE